MRVLITYGSKRGGTREIAEVLQEALEQGGHDVDVYPPRGIESLAPWDAVVVGGALYASRWHRDARRFVRRHTDELERMPVWFFSSGPLGDDEQKPEIPPTRQVGKLMDVVGARGHVTFGGRLEKNPGGVIAGAMARNGFAGDWRNIDAVRAWGRMLGEELATSAQPLPRPVRSQHGLRAALGMLTLFGGLTAVAGGIELIARPQGTQWLDRSLLDPSPFTTFLIPGLLLLVLVGLLNTAAGVLVLRRHRWGEPACFVAGGSMTVWIIVEMMMLQTVHWLQLFYLAVGVATLAVATVLWRRRRMDAHREPVVLGTASLPAVPRADRPQART